MRREPYPGAKCRVIGSQLGPKGSTVGRVVKVIDRADPPEHIAWGPMWDCVPLDGMPFKVVITSPDMQTTSTRDSSNATFAQDWLEVIEDDPEPPKVEEKQQELVE